MNFSNLSQHVINIYEDIKTQKVTKMQSASYLIASFLKFYSEGAMPPNCDRNEARAVYDALDKMVNKDEIDDTLKILTGRLGSLREDAAYRKIIADSEIAAQNAGNSVITADIILNCALNNAPNGIREILSENRAAIDKIVEELMLKNHLKGEEIDAIFSACAKKENT